MQKQELTEELNTFLGLLHQDKESEYKIYENYLFGGDLDDLEQEISKVTKKNGDLSIIYSAPESEQSTQRENSQLNELFHKILRDLQLGIRSQKTDSLKDCENKIKSLQKCISVHLSSVSKNLSDLQDKNQQIESNNQMLIEALQSAQQEIQMLQRKQKHPDEESLAQLRRQIKEYKKQNEDLTKKLYHNQQANELLMDKLEQQQTQYQINEEEFREASNRLIKSNQALREIIVNMGNISPLNKSKLQEVIKYLTNGKDLGRGRSSSKQTKENQYSTLSSQRTKKSMSPQGYNSTRKALKESDYNTSNSKANILDSNYQTSYKELFLKSLKVQKISK